MIEEIADQFTTEELREFLEADREVVPVDPVFKEKLRRQLWEIVRERAADEDQRKRER